VSVLPSVLALKEIQLRQSTTVLSAQQIILSL
jgi:hypothetical protein